MIFFFLNSNNSRFNLYLLIYGNICYTLVKAYPFLFNDNIFTYDIYNILKYPVVMMNRIIGLY